MSKLDAQRVKPRNRTTLMRGDLQDLSLLVDRFERTLIALRNDDGVWTPVLELDDGTPTGELTVGEYGVVGFDLTTLFAF